MALHYTFDGFWYFFICNKSNTLSWHTSNFGSAHKKPSLIRVASCAFPDVFLVSNYHSCKENTTKILPHRRSHNPRKVEPPFSGVRLKRNTKPPGSPFISSPLKDLRLHLSLSLQHFTLNICGYYCFFAEYKLITC